MVWGDGARRDFPNLFNIATDKNAMVSSILHVEEGKVSWSPTFRRHLQDLEIEGDRGFRSVLE